MTEIELAILLIRNAIAIQKAQADAYTDANDDPLVRAVGNASIANCLETLGGRGIVADVQPTFSANGIGFSYRIDSSLINELSSDDLISRKVEALFEGPASETALTLLELLAACELASFNGVYRDDLLASIKELRLCFTNECYIACLALSGKILEICLKQLLVNSDIPFEEGWMIGRLLSKLRESESEKYLDQSLPEIAVIINKSRIPAVHAKEKIPVPSREQAIMVIHAVVDTVNRSSFPHNGHHRGRRSEREFKHDNRRNQVTG